MIAFIIRMHVSENKSPPTHPRNSAVAAYDLDSGPRETVDCIGHYIRSVGLLSVRAREKLVVRTFSSKSICLASVKARGKLVVRTIASKSTCLAEKEYLTIAQMQPKPVLTI